MRCVFITQFTIGWLHLLREYEVPDWPVLTSQPSVSEHGWSSIWMH